MSAVIKNVKQIGGSKFETKDGAFSRCALQNRDGDGNSPSKVRRAQNKRIRQELKRNLLEISAEINASKQS